MRTRKSSNEQPLSPSSSIGKSKGKSKQVEFSEEVQVKEASPNPLDEASDLTDLTEVEESLVTPSPRRLRSKGGRPKTTSKGKERADGDVDVGKRVTPMRKAKQNTGSLAEDVDEDEEDQLESDADQEDQFASPFTTPKAARRTPVKRRLRPRQIQTHTPPSDGDDEQSADEGVEESVDGDEVSSEDDVTTIASNEYVEEAPAEPRILRNRKVVDEDEAAEEYIGSEDEENEEDEESQLSAVEEAEGEVEVGAEEAEELMEDDGA